MGAGTAAGRVIGVIGAAGGCGASTVAALFALHAARSGHGVVLVDGCPGGGGLDVILGIEHVPGVRWPDLAGVEGAVDGAGLLDRLPRCALSHGRALPVLAHAREGQVASAALTGRVARALGDQAGSVVVELSRDGLDPAVLSEVSSAVLMTNATVTGLAAVAAAAARVAPLITDTWVLLRGATRNAAVAADVEDALDLPLLGIIPDDARLLRALVAGQPPEVAGPAGRVCAAAVEQMLGDPPTMRAG